MPTPIDIVAQSFITLLGRAPTASELIYYQTTIANINSETLAVHGNQTNYAGFLVNNLPECQQKYNGLPYYQVISILYINAFSRSATINEMKAWAPHLTSVQGKIYKTVIAITEVAQSSDITVLTAKINTAINSPYTGVTGLKTSVAPPELNLPPVKWEVSQDKTIGKTKVNLGDGYSLDAVSYNGIRTNYSIVIPGLNTATKNSIVATLKSYQGHKKFKWRPISILPFKEFVCNNFSVKAIGINQWEIACNFTEIK